MTERAVAASAPSDRARALVEGAYDLHVHVAPDVPARRIDDRSLAQRFAELGLAGFALKSHYTSTAERAQVVSGLFDAVEVFGTLTLTSAVGGMNALAVEIAAREGARIVWMPTVDSPAETAGRTEPKEGDKVPQWARLQHELRTRMPGEERPLHRSRVDPRIAIPHHHEARCRKPRHTLTEVRAGEHAQIAEPARRVHRGAALLQLGLYPSV